MRKLTHSPRIGTIFAGLQDAQRFFLAEWLLEFNDHIHALLRSHHTCATISAGYNRGLAGVADRVRAGKQG